MSRSGFNAAIHSRLFGALMLAAAVGISLQACSSVPRRLTPPQANLLALTVLDAGPEGQLFALRLQLVNPNVADIPAVRLDFDIRLGGEGRLIGEYATAFTLAGRGSETLDIEVFSELVSSGSRLMANARGPDNALNYEFHGELVLETRLREPIEIFRRGQVPLTVRDTQ